MNRVSQFLARHWPISLLVCFQFLAYLVLGLLTHAHFRSAGFDLGIFDQAVWHYSHIQAPTSTIRGLDNILGDHFHPILILLAPLYWIYPHAQTLIVAQSALLASSTVPVYLFCKDKLGDRTALLVAAAYALNWGLQNAAGFDFHEIAFSVPAIAWMLYAIERQRWRLYAAAALVLLLSKEDQALLLLFFGAYLLLRKYWLPAILSIAAGGGWFVLAIKFLIPHFSGGAGYSHWNYSQIGATPSETLRTVLEHPLRIIRMLVDNPIKRVTLKTLAYPFLGLCLLSPLMVLAIPLIAERMLSDVPNYWSKAFHYSATIAPILACAAAEGIANLERLARRYSRHARNLPFTLGLLLLAGNIFLSRHFPFSYQLADPNFYRLNSNEKVGYEALAVIPDKASVTTLNGISPHLSDRQHITLLPDDSAQYIVISPNVNFIPLASYAQAEAYVATRIEAGGTRVFNKDGWTVIRMPNQTPAS